MMDCGQSVRNAAIAARSVIALKIWRKRASIIVGTCDNVGRLIRAWPPRKCGSDEKTTRSDIGPSIANTTRRIAKNVWHCRESGTRKTAKDAESCSSDGGKEIWRRRELWRGRVKNEIATRSISGIGTGALLKLPHLVSTRSRIFGGFSRSKKADAPTPGAERTSRTDITLITGLLLRAAGQTTERTFNYSVPCAIPASTPKTL